jgi:hypothetical protein
MPFADSLTDYLDSLCTDKPKAAPSVDESRWREALPIIGPYIRRDLRIEQTEAIEDVLKAYLVPALRQTTGADNRLLADWSRKMGFVLKHKPYGVKCAVPLGYSIFFLKPGEGFSFQRHLTKKVEVFHILQPLDHAKAFLSSSAQWESVYDAKRFAQWLSGSPDPAFDRFSRTPQAGDVMYVSELGVVHSILGCVLEEFATVSVDLVDRLHDQNSRAPVTDYPPRAEVEAWLKALPTHLPTVAYDTLEHEPKPLERSVSGDHVSVVLRETDALMAEKFQVDAGGLLALDVDAARPRALCILGGHCDLFLRGRDESASADVAAIRLGPGDVTLVAPGAAAELRVHDRVSLSSQRVDAEVALAK